MRDSSYDSIAFLVFSLHPPSLHPLACTCGSLGRCSGWQPSAFAVPLLSRTNLGRWKRPLLVTKAVYSGPQHQMAHSASIYLPQALVVYSEFHCLHFNLSHWSLEVFLWFPLFYLDCFIIQSFYLIFDNEWKMVSHSFSWSCLISCDTYWYNLWHLNLWPQLLSIDSSMPCVYLAFRFLSDSFLLCFGDVTQPWFSIVTFL